MKTKDILKEKLLNIYKKTDANIYKIHLTLKECNIGPNIKLFYDKDGYKYSERIFLTNIKNEKTEEELLKELDLLTKPLWNI